MELRELKVSNLDITRGYSDHYQVAFPDRVAHEETKRELEAISGVTTFEYIQSMRREFDDIAQGKSNDFIIIAGSCEEPVDINIGIDEHVNNATNLLSAMSSSRFTGVLPILRNRGQSFKPRSSEYETGPDGNQIYSFYGSGINGLDYSDRTPDSSRLVATAMQARDVEEALTARIGHHVGAAHEALLIDYESCFIREYPENGRRYLLSADLPWVGVRTNSIDSEVMTLLEGIENPIGVKIGPTNTAEDIAAIAKKLNPNAEAGKLIFMLRLGINEIIKRPDMLPSLLSAIIEYDSGSILTSDPMHGNTIKRPDNRKTRVVSDICAEISAVTAACRDLGMKLHGIHLEAVGSDDIRQCIDTHQDNPGNRPQDISAVDPQLNTHQLHKVIDHAAESMHEFTLAA